MRNLDEVRSFYDRAVEPPLDPEITVRVADCSVVLGVHNRGQRSQFAVDLEGGDLGGSLWSFSTIRWDGGSGHQVIDHDETIEITLFDVGDSKGNSSVPLTFNTGSAPGPTLVFSSGGTLTFHVTEIRGPLRQPFAVTLRLRVGYDPQAGDSSIEVAVSSVTRLQ